MGIETGFDLYPPLSKGDQRQWEQFLAKVKKNCAGDPTMQWHPKKSPRAAIVFAVGEDPSLPKNGHTFRCFSSKVQSTNEVEDCINKVASMAEEHFGKRRIHRWFDGYDDSYSLYICEESEEGREQEEDAPPSSCGTEPKPLCSNHSSGHEGCKRIASKTCANCQLLAYCSRECQLAHWPIHKKECRGLLASDHWRPKWAIEERLPAFISGQARSPLQSIPRLSSIYLWGNTPAYDLLSLWTIRHLHHKDRLSGFRRPSQRHSNGCQLEG